MMMPRVSWLFFAVVLGLTPVWGQVLPRCRLLGPHEQIELPADNPVIVHVFRPTCATDGPPLEQLKALQDAGKPFPFRQVYAVVTITPDETYPDLAERLKPLVYDVGGETLRLPFHLNGFTTVIVDPRGFVTRVGHPGQWGYMGRLWTTAESLQTSLAHSGRTVRLLPATGGAAGSAQTSPPALSAEASPPDPGWGWLLVAPFALATLVSVFLGRRWRGESRRRLGSVLELQPGLRCAICADVFEREQALVACSACVTVSHRACVKSAGGCQTIGCSGSTRTDRFAPRGGA